MNDWGLVNTVRVEIDDNHDLVKDFLDWVGRSAIPNIEGHYRSNGKGQMVDIYHARHRDSIRAFFLDWERTRSNNQKGNT